MPEDDTEAAQKIKDFLTDVFDLAQGKLPYSSIDTYVNQAVIFHTIDKLDTQVKTLKSIKHLLNENQTKDINAMIEQYTLMKAALYEKL